MHTTYYILIRISSHRSNFDQKFDVQMRLMGAIKGDPDNFDDEKGHVVGSQFGGLAVSYNLVPMINSQNRNRGVRNTYTPSYYDVEMRMADYLRLQCGVVDFQVDVNYCECSRMCNGGRSDEPGGEWRPASFDITHVFVFYVNGTAMHFPNAFSSTHVGNRVGLVDKRKKQKRARRESGTCRATGIETIPRTARRSKRALATASGPDIVVTMAKGYQVSFNRYDCVPLNEAYRLSSNSIVLDKGSCVKVYDGRSCTGSSRIVVQKGFRKLYSVHKVDESELLGVKSITGCCREIIGDKSDVFGMAPEFQPKRYQFKNSSKRRRRQAVNRNVGQMLVESECSCSCLNNTTSMKKN